jgi:hypothetical protein
VSNLCGQSPTVPFLDAVDALDRELRRRRREKLLDEAVQNVMSRETLLLVGYGHITFPAPWVVDRIRAQFAWLVGRQPHETSVRVVFD